MNESNVAKNVHHDSISHKEERETIMKKLVVTLLFVSAFLLLAPAALAAAVNNTGTGDVNGVNTDLDDSNTFVLNTQTLALIKRAFLADGTAIVSGASIPKGTLVKFMIYINNNTPIAVNDVSVQDVLAAELQYQAGTIKVSNTVVDCGLNCDGTEEAAIYTAVDSGTAVTDLVSVADVGGYTAPNIDLGNQNAGNGQLNIAANRVWAVIFSVKVQ